MAGKRTETQLDLMHGAAAARRLSPLQFAAKWTTSTLKERSAAQEHFIDLCRLLDEPTPADVDPHGEWYCFERGAKKTGGGDGWADVWKRGYFAWEYKGKRHDLDVAFAQLQRYAIALENPPLLVVSDMARIEIHTNFTNSVHEKHVIPIADVGSEQNLKLLKWTFTDPEKLRPGRTKTAITEEAAQRFASLAKVLRDRGGEAERVAHFLNRVLFCLFAQDAGLLPSRIVVELLETGVKRPSEANKMLRTLFATMKKGGNFGTHIIDWFNGNLFDSNDAVPLESGDIQELLSVATLDWSEIEPSIFGTLFERGLDPTKRAQIGAHYTDTQSIMRIVEPVIVTPLRAEWAEAKESIEQQLAKLDRTSDSSSRSKIRRQAQDIFHDFLLRLAEFKVLDPACGSGNFLYLALQSLKDLEHQSTLEAEHMGLEASFAAMHVGVHCVRGIELNPYAAELARVTVWIGEIQWMIRHGIPPSKNPILKPLETIECGDAILTVGGREPSWPKVNAVVGNPPFLGDKKMLRELGSQYVSALRKRYKGRVPGGADLVTYWFEKARAQVRLGNADSVGLVATSSIRGGASRKVLDRIHGELSIFDAWSDEPWVNEGAAVRVSLVCFADGRTGGSRPIHLNGKPVREVLPNLSPRSESESAAITDARPLVENLGIAFSGITKKGSFDVDGDVARSMLLASGNPHGKPNSDVLAPWKNGAATTGRDPDKWIITFGERKLSEASLYQSPFAHVRRHVLPERTNSNTPAEKKLWWLLARRAPDFFAAIRRKARYIATPEVSKHRVFVWLPSNVIPDKNLVAIAKDDDTTFGILSSRFHCAWALELGTSLEDRPRYTSSTTFRTFPFPQLTAGTRASIGRAAQTLNELREAWLNPDDWVEYEPEVVKGFPRRLIPRLGHEADLRTRTLTNLYNERPSWLQIAHEELDQAVAGAYGWNDYTAAMTDAELINRLLRLNLERAGDLLSRSALPNEGLIQLAAAGGRHGSESDRSVPARPGDDVLDRRLAVVCTLVNRLADDRHFGRTKMAKLFYLADATQDLDLQTTYYREAAGPLDTSALYNKATGLEAMAIRNGFIQVQPGKQVKYIRGKNLGEGLQKARENLGKQRTALNKLIDLFRKLDTEQCEIIATLYACWNDKVLDGEDACDESIVEEFLNKWHERKRRFQRDRLVKALQWMKANSLVPTGRAPHTKMRPGKRA